MAARAEAVAAEAGQGEVGGVADQMADPGQGGGVGVARTVTMTTPVGVLVAVQDVARVVVAEQEGEEEVRRPDHLHPPGHFLPQKIYWTRTFSLVGPFFTLRPSRPDLVERR